MGIASLEQNSVFSMTKKLSVMTQVSILHCTQVPERTDPSTVPCGPLKNVFELTNVQVQNDLTDRGIRKTEN